MGDALTDMALCQARIDVLGTELDRAERTVGRARTAAAAANAHRRADALLLELEAAEEDLRVLQNHLARPRSMDRPSGGAQGHLFDVG